MEDMFYMEKALELAIKAEGDTSPNPMVGCIIIDKNGTIIGEGYHHKAGEPHAEVMALKDVEEKNKTQDIFAAYVTLEPCSHFGRTGPCCDALIKAGVKKVVCALGDPNPKVSGQGFKRLKDAGVEVKVGVLEEKAKKVNEKFLYWITHNKPFVSIKYAMTLDGKIATAKGDSKWITADDAREYGHYLRKTHDAILVGINTTLQDGAQLTNRAVPGKSPIRIVLDTKGRIPLEAKVLTGNTKTIIVMGKDGNKEKIKALEKLPNITVWQLGTNEGHVDLDELMTKMGENNICSVLVEGGSEIHGAFLEKRLVHKVYAFIAPKPLGGKDGLTPIGGKSPDVIAESLELTNMEIKHFARDVLLIANVKEVK